MNLYEYDRRLEECIDTETGEVDVEKLEQLNLERTEKLENLIMWSKEKRAFIESLKTEISNLEARLAAEEKSADKLEAYIGDYLDHKKFKTPKCEVKFTKSTYVACENEKEWVQKAIESGDTRFINITEKIVKNQKLDKTKIKEFLKDGNNKLDGVRLETRYSYKAL